VQRALSRPSNCCNCKSGCETDGEQRNKCMTFGAHVSRSTAICQWPETTQDTDQTYYLAESLLAEQAFLSIPTHFSVARSVICHIRAPSRWTNLDAIWHRHLGSKYTLCRWGSLPQVRGDLGSNLRLKHGITATWGTQPKSCVDWRQRFRVLLNYFGLVSFTTP